MEVTFLLFFFSSSQFVILLYKFGTFCAELLWVIFSNDLLILHLKMEVSYMYITHMLPLTPLLA
jgi:hypothetical protein